MNLMTYQEAFQLLHRAGFREKEIDRLYRLRQHYATHEQDQPPLDPRRLQFARWLVTTGRLTDRISEEGTSAEVPLLVGWPWLKTILAHLRSRIALPL